MKKTLTAIIAITFIVVLYFGSARADEFNRTMLPIPDPPFQGKIGLRTADSKKDFPREIMAPTDAPNISSILFTGVKS